MKFNIELIIKLIILIILLLLVFITSFRTGTKFYLLKNTFLNSSEESVKSEVARWNFKARAFSGDEVFVIEKH